MPRRLSVRSEALARRGLATVPSRPARRVGGMASTSTVHRSPRKARAVGVGALDLDLDVFLRVAVSLRRPSAVDRSGRPRGRRRGVVRRRVARDGAPARRPVHAQAPGTLAVWRNP
jgi:hypothetical protein